MNRASIFQGINNIGLGHIPVDIHIHRRLANKAPKSPFNRGNSVVRSNDSALISEYDFTTRRLSLKSRTIACPTTIEILTICLRTVSSSMLNETDWVRWVLRARTSSNMNLPATSLITSLLAVFETTEVISCNFRSNIEFSSGGFPVTGKAFDMLQI